MKTKVLAAFLSGALLTSVVSQPTRAQNMSTNYYSSGWVNPYNNTMTQIYQSNTNMIAQQAISDSQMFTNMAIANMNTGGGTSSARARRLKKMPKRERSEAQRFAKYNGTMFKAASASQTPAKLAAVFAKGTAKQSDREYFAKTFKVFLDVYKQRAKQQNAPATDVARTLAFCIAANHYYRSGTMPSEAQIAALRGKMRAALSESSKFRALSNAQKQGMNETMVILTFLVAYGVDEVAEKAPADKRSQVLTGFRTLAGINLKGLLGVDPKRVTFDKAGLVIKA